MRRICDLKHKRAAKRNSSNRSSYVTAVVAHCAYMCDVAQAKHSNWNVLWIPFERSIMRLNGEKLMNTYKRQTEQTQYAWNTIWYDDKLNFAFVVCAVAKWVEDNLRRRDAEERATNITWQCNCSARARIIIVGTRDLSKFLNKVHTLYVRTEDQASRTTSQFNIRWFFVLTWTHTRFLY